MELRDIDLNLLVLFNQLLTDGRVSKAAHRMRWTTAPRAQSKE